MNVGVNRSIDTCCDRCKDHCYNVESQKVLDALYAAKIHLSNNSQKKLAYKKQGYIKNLLCKDIEEELTKNTELLEEYLRDNRVKDFQHCLCVNEIEKIVDSIIGNIDMSCCSSGDRCDLIIDESNYAKWVMEHPDCLVYEEWEAAYLGICTKFKFGDVFKEDEPKLIYELAVKEISNKCDLITAISIQNECEKQQEFDFAITKEENCSREIDVKVSFEEACKQEYKFIVEAQNCGITIDTYVQLRECGVKAEVISKLLECGYNIKANVEKQSCDIQIDTETVITLCDYKFSINSDHEDCKIVSEILGVNMCP